MSSIVRCWRLPVGGVLCALGLGALAAHAEEAVATKSAQESYPATYTREQIAFDFGVFRDALEQAHPGLYRYRSKEEMDRVFETAEGKLGEVRTERDFYLVLGSVVAEIGDGHTRVRVSEGYENFLDGGPTFLPFKLRVIDRRAYLWRDYSEGRADLVGAEIVSMNGRPMAEVLDEMVSYFSSDGSNVTGKYKDLEGTVLFGTLYQLVFGPADTYELELKPAGSEETIKASLPGLTRAVVDERYEERYGEQEKNLELTMIVGSPPTAMLRIGGFFGDDYENFLADAFRQIEEHAIEYLILDLRDNGGGRDMYGSMLLSYLVGEPFAYYESMEIMGPELPILRYSQNPTWSMPAEKYAERDGRYLLTEAAHDNLKIQEPRAPGFDGEVYVLISGASFSATSELLAALWQNREATYIGEESGGGMYGNTSGATGIITLPHTKLRVNVPLMRYNSAVEGYEPTDRGMIPDHEIHLSQQNLVDGTDSVVDFTLELIRDAAGTSQGERPSQPD